MIAEILNQLNSVSGPNKGMKIILIAFLLLAGAIMIDVQTGLISHWVLKQRAESLLVHRQLLKDDQNEELDAKINALRLRAVEIEEGTQKPLERLKWLIPFGKSAWPFFVLGISLYIFGIQSKEFKSSLPNESIRTKNSALVAAPFMWAGLIVGFLGVLYNRSSDFLSAYVLFPLIAFISVAVLMVFFSMLSWIAVPDSVHAEIDKERATANAANKK